MTSEPDGPTAPTGTGIVTPARFAKVRAIFEAAFARPGSIAGCTTRGIQRFWLAETTSRMASTTTAGASICT